jgi:hypothetical protein
MKPEVALALIGLVVTVIGIVVATMAWLVPRSRALRALRHPRTQGIGIGVLLGALILFTVSFLWPDRNASSGVTTSSTTTHAVSRRTAITSPGQDDVVPHEISVRGTASGLRPGEVVWLVDREEGGDLYYAHDHACPVRDGGAWHCPGVIIGVEKDTKRYEIIAVIIDADALNRFLDWQYNGVETGQYPGMAGLPEGVVHVPSANSEGRIFVRRA